MRCSLVIFALLFPAMMHAKIAGPAPVEPVVFQGLRYEAPNDKARDGYIRITGAKTGRWVATVEIYHTTIDPSMEEDVQWVFIRKMEIKDGKLFVTDTRDRMYVVDPSTRKVTQLKN